MWLVNPELANLASHLWILTAPCSGTNGFQELPVSCNHLGSGLSLHLYKHLHPLLLTCGLLYSAAKLVNSCNQIAVLLTACMKVNNTSIFQCPASSLMTLLTVLVGSLSDITNSGTLKTIVSVLTQATWFSGQRREVVQAEAFPQTVPVHQCPVPSSSHSMVWWLAGDSFTLLVNCASHPRQQPACSGFVFGCDWCLRSLF